MILNSGNLSPHVLVKCIFIQKKKSSIEVQIFPKETFEGFFVILSINVFTDVVGGKIFLSFLTEH